MRKLLLLLSLFVAFMCVAAVAADAQTTTHSVTLSWVDNSNPTGTTYNVYRASGLCSGSSVFSKLASAVAAFTYVDSTVTVGSYCYQVTAVSNSVEGAPSNQVNPTIGPFTVTLSVKSVQ